MQPKNLQMKALQISNQILKQLGQTSTVTVNTEKIDDITFYYLNFKTISSTMQISERWPRQLVNPTTFFVFTAESQSQGVGQKNNRWLSPPGNLYMTILATLEMKLLYVLSMICGLSTCKFLESAYQLQPKIKWINDVIINDKKVSGVLVRTELESLTDPYFIAEIGVGINIHECPLEFSTCIDKEVSSNKIIEVNDVRKMFLTKFVETLGQLKESISPLKDKIKIRLMYLGQHVYVYDSALSTILHQGVFEDVNEHLHAILNTGKQSEVIMGGRMRNNKQNNEKIVHK